MKTFRHLFCWLTAAMLTTTTLPLLAEAPLKVGDKAPHFSGHDQDGKRWSLGAHLGKKMVLLCFYPEDGTAGSTTEASKLTDKMAELQQAGVDVVGVSCENRKHQKEFVFKYNLDFPMLADTGASIADDYGARMAGQKKMDRRVSFLIGLDGKILHITDSPNPAVHLSEMAATLARVTAPGSR